MSELVLILTTTPDGDLGDRIAATLVGERLAACVNVHGPMVSFYRWHGAVERETERQIVIKTTKDRVEPVLARIAQLHSYELPELVVVPIADGSPPYLDWIRAETRDAS
jgi:periplasmic divalent cation tolerance protein